MKGGQHRPKAAWLWRKVREELPWQGTVVCTLGRGTQGAGSCGRMHACMHAGMHAWALAHACKSEHAASSHALKQAAAIADQH